MDDTGAGVQTSNANTVTQAHDPTTNPTGQSAPPYPEPSPTTPYTNQGLSSSTAPYPQPQQYPSDTTQGAPYPPQGAPYPPQGAPYPPQSAPYPPQSAPYPPQGAPYPPQGDSYPPQGAPYPAPGEEVNPAYPPPAYPGPPDAAYPPQTGVGAPPIDTKKYDPAAAPGGYQPQYQQQPPVTNIAIVRTAQVDAGTEPQSYLFCSIISVCFCLVFGIVAIVYSAQVSSLWAQGRYVEARRASMSARGWAVAAFVVGCIIIIFNVIRAYAFY